MHGAPAIEGRDGAPAPAPKSFPGALGSGERGARCTAVHKPPGSPEDGMPGELFA